MKKKNYLLVQKCKGRGKSQCLLACKSKHIMIWELFETQILISLPIYTILTKYDAKMLVHNVIKAA